MPVLNYTFATVCWGVGVLTGMCHCLIVYVNLSVLLEQEYP